MSVTQKDIKTTFVQLIAAFTRSKNENSFYSSQASKAGGASSQNYSWPGSQGGCVVIRLGRPSDSVISVTSANQRADG